MILQNAGGYTPEQAKAAALQVLPDILHYDRTQPATYPNGRIPTDDVYSARFAWLTNGKVPPSGLKPHDDLLAQLPLPRPAQPQVSGGRSDRRRGKVIPRSVREKDCELFRTDRGATVRPLVSFLPGDELPGRPGPPERAGRGPR